MNNSDPLKELEDKLSTIFDAWMVNDYPKLPPEKKKRIKHVRRNYINRGRVKFETMLSVMGESGYKFDINRVA